MINIEFFRKTGRVIVISLTVFTIILCNQNILEAETGFDKIDNKEVVDIIKKFSDYKNPKLSAIMLLYDKRYILNNDHTVSYKEHVLIKVLTSGGRDIGTIALPFNEYFQKMKINVARTIQPDGEIMDISTDAISEEAPYYNLPIYSDIKVKKVTFPAVRVGSIVEYKVEYTSDYKDLPGFSTMLALPSRWHVALARFSVTVPKDMPVNYRAVRMMNPDPVVTSSNGRDIYSWEMSHVWVKGSDEPLLPSYMKFGRYVIFTAIPGWEEISKGCKKLMQGQAEPDEEIIRKVKELTSGIEKDKNAMIKSFYNCVSQNIRYVAIELGLSAFRPYPASQVFKNEYGDCKGKSALLISMLKSVGIPAYYTLILTTDSGFIEPDLPTFSFNHVIVAIPNNGGYLFVDPVAELLPFGSLPLGVQGADALVLSNKEVEFVKIPVDSADKNKSFEETKIIFIANDSIRIISKESFKGQKEWLGRIMAKHIPPGQYKETLQQAVGSSFPNAILRDVTVSDYQNLDEPFGIELIIEVNSFAKKSGELLIFKVPQDLSLILASATAKERREASLDILYPEVIKSRSIIKMPEPYQVKYIPQDLSLDTPVISFDGKFQVEDNEIIITTKLTVKQHEISCGKYPSFRNVVRKIRELYNENIILEERGGI